MKFLTKEEADKYIQEADGLRTDYINSNHYVRDLCDTVFQHLNLKGNEYDSESFYKFQTEIEFMALYQQLLDVCPEAFSGRDQEVIKASLQKSIYASIRPQLSPNYINELENNNRDSFLIIPSNLDDLPESTDLHGVALILMKEKNQIIVSIFDKSQEKQRTNDVKTTCRYTVGNTETQIKTIADILHLGLGYPQEEGQAILNEWMKLPGFLYEIFDTIAKEREVCNHIGMGQFFQRNCSINNLNGALKYVLGEEHVVKDPVLKDKMAVKTKYKDLTTEKYNSIIVSIVLAHLVKLEADTRSTRLLADAYAIYHLLKKTRATNKKGLDRFAEKVELGKYMQEENEKYIHLIPNTSIGHPVMKEELSSLYKLTEEEINYIQEKSHHLLNNIVPPVSQNMIRKIAEVHQKIMTERKVKDTSFTR